MGDKISLIWDLDGTLLDSYDVIVSSLYKVCQEYNIDLSYEYIKTNAIKYSVSYIINKIVSEKNISFDSIKNRYSEISELNNDKIIPMKHSIELLDKLKQNGVDNYVFTHRGLSTDFVLNNIKMKDYFIEIVSSKSGFNRKPSPDALNYLIDKYNLDRNNTYYVGDRTLDIECAFNANLKSILYLPDGGITTPTGKETYIVSDLIDILDKLNLK